MKKTLILVLIFFVSISLFSCTRSIDDYQNVVWSSDSGILTLYIEGQSTTMAFGQLILNEETVDVVGLFSWSPHTLTLYTKSGVENIDKYGYATISDLFADFHVSTPGSCYGLFSDDEMTLTTKANYSEFEELDDLELIMTVSYLSTSDLDAKNFIDMNWNNEDIGLSFDSDYLSYFTHILYGKIEYDGETTDIYFLFQDDSGFSIYEDSYDETILLSGTYETHEQSMTLYITEDNYYDNAYSEIEMYHVQKY